MDDDEFKVWFSGIHEDMKNLIKSLKEQFPPVEKIAIIRTHVGAAPTVALYLWGARDNKKIAAIAMRTPPTVFVNGRELPLQVFDLHSPTNPPRDQRIKRGARISPDKAAEFNNLITRNASEVIMEYDNVSIVMPVVVDEEKEEVNVMVALFHGGVIVNLDGPIPSSIGGIPTLVREGGAFTQEDRTYRGYESDDEEEEEEK